MEAGTEEKDTGLCEGFTFFPSNYGLEVDMSIEKIVNWFVPFPVELLKSERIPPILIELPVIQPCHFSKEITHIFEDEVETEDDEGSAWNHQSQHKFNYGYF